MAMDLGSGVIWEYALPTSRSDVASTVATNIVAMGASLVALGLNGFFVPPYWGTRVKSLHSTPLLEGHPIYYTSHTTVGFLHHDPCPRPAPKAAPSKTPPPRPRRNSNPTQSRPLRA